MRGRAALRPVSLTARVNRLERELQPRESHASIESRAMLTRWLGESVDGADLWIEYLELVEAVGSTEGVLQLAEGRDAVLAVIHSLYTLYTPPNDLNIE